MIQEVGAKKFSYQSWWQGRGFLKKENKAIHGCQIQFVCNTSRLCNGLSLLHHIQSTIVFIDYQSNFDTVVYVRILCCFHLAMINILVMYDKRAVIKLFKFVPIRCSNWGTRKSFLLATPFVIMVKTFDCFWTVTNMYCPFATKHFGCLIELFMVEKDSVEGKEDFTVLWKVFFGTGMVCIRTYGIGFGIQRLYLCNQHRC